MNLEEFVAETLLQVIRGVERAQEALGDSTAAVAPTVKSASADSKHIATHHGIAATNIQFDVAITVESNVKDTAKAGLAVLPVVIGGERGTSDRDQTVSRVSFNVPVQLPPDRRTYEEVTAAAKAHAERNKRVMSRLNKSDRV